VTRCGTCTVRGVLYSAPSRLISHRLKVRVYSDRLDCYLSGALVHSTTRATSTSKGRGRAIDYRHFIEALKRKLQAFRGLVFRDDLFPREAECPVVVVEMPDAAIYDTLLAEEVAV
jgi:hypothetical protein